MSDNPLTLKEQIQIIEAELAARESYLRWLMAGQYLTTEQVNKLK